MLHAVPSITESSSLSEEECDPMEEAYPLILASTAKREMLSIFFSTTCIAAGDEKQKSSESKLGPQVREVDGV